MMNNREEELTEEVRRLKDERRTEDRDRWTALFTKMDNLTQSHNDFKASTESLLDRHEEGLREMRNTLYGPARNSGLRSKVEKMASAAGVLWFVCSTAILAACTALADNFFHLFTRK